jgi:hypothetical protein
MRWLVSAWRPESLKRWVPALRVRCSRLSMEMVWAKRLELGHQATMAEVWERLRTLRPEGANERSGWLVERKVRR